MTDWETDKYNDKYLYRSEVNKFSENLRVNLSARHLSYWGLTRLVAQATCRTGFVYQRFSLVILIMF